MKLKLCPIIKTTRLHGYPARCRIVEKYMSIMNKKPEPFLAWALKIYRMKKRGIK